MPKTMLVKNADVVVTMDAVRRETRNGGLFVADRIFGPRMGFAPLNPSYRALVR